MRTDETDPAPHLGKSKHDQGKARLESHGKTLPSVCQDPHKHTVCVRTLPSVCVCVCVCMCQDPAQCVSGPCPESVCFCTVSLCLCICIFWNPCPVNVLSSPD